MILRPSLSGFPSMRPSPTLRAAPICLVRRPKLPEQSGAVFGRSLAFRSQLAWRAPSTWRKLPRKRPSPTGWWFADLRSVSRSITLDAPISTTTILAEFAEELLRTVLAQHPCEKTISLLAISVSNLEECPELQLELPLGLPDESRRPGSKRGMARWAADRAVDTIRDRFGWDAVGYGS